MKTQLLIIALIILPAFLFSQEAVELKRVNNPEKKIVSVKKSDIYQLNSSQKMIKPLSESERIEFKIPEDFPRCATTGDMRKNENEYYKAQQAWINKNPEAFKLISKKVNNSN